MNAQIFEKENCRLSFNDRPCKPHKDYGVKCNNCEYYNFFNKRILIIKLAADGDVLRTTCLLPKLKEKYPNAHITWITALSAKPLLEKNPHIDRIWAPPEQYLPELMVEQFDLVINTDADPHSCALASVVCGGEIRGYKLNSDGSIKHFSDIALHWKKMGKWDDLKRENRRTYPEIIYEISGLEKPIYGPQLHLSQEENKDALDYLCNAGWEPKNGRPVVGINTGAGTRWKKKSLPIETLKSVIAHIEKNNSEIDIFLLGGPNERERNDYLANNSCRNVIHTGTDNSLRRFAAIVDQTDVLLSGDTLAMHIGIALGKYVVAHFGPTSPWEIDLFKKNRCIVSAIDCVCCYLPDCDRNPACNEIITSEEIVTHLYNGLIFGKGKAYENRIL